MTTIVDYLMICAGLAVAALAFAIGVHEGPPALFHWFAIAVGGLGWSVYARDRSQEVGEA